MALLHPLEMDATDADGKSHKEFAINEVSLLRMTAQAAKLKFQSLQNPHGRIDLRRRFAGHLAGSTAYNLSAHGPILLINAKWLAHLICFFVIHICVFAGKCQSHFPRAGGR